MAIIENRNLECVPHGAPLDSTPVLSVFKLQYSCGLINISFYFVLVTTLGGEISSGNKCHSQSRFQAAAEPGQRGNLIPLS